MPQDLKKTRDEELEEIRKSMSHQIENKETNYKRNQIEILEWKSTITR